MTRLTIIDLQPGQCKFPITPFDAPKHFFCGEPVEYENCPYCPTHAAICFDRRTTEVKAQRARILALARAARSAESRRTAAANQFPGVQLPRLPRF